MMTNRGPDWLGWAVIVLCCVMVVLCGTQPRELLYGEVPEVSVKTGKTDEAISHISQDIREAKRGIEERAEKVRDSITYVRQEEATSVEALSPDAVAVGVVDELRLFLRGVGSGDCLSICP